MAKLGAILGRQFKKLGIDITDDIKALVELDTEIPDEVGDKIDKGLLTIEAAKTNSEVNKALRKNILSGADQKMDEIIKEMGINPGEDFANETNTYEKIAILSKALHAEGKKKGEGTSKEGASETLRKEREIWTSKETEMQKQLKTLSENLTSKETEFKNTRESDLTSFELQKILLGKDYVFPKDMDSSIKVQTALGALNKDLTEKGLVIKRNEGGSLIITDKDGNPAYINHTPVDSPQSYIDGVLTHNKLLNINDPNQQQQQQQQGQSGSSNLQNGGANPNAHVLADIQAQIKNL